MKKVSLKKISAPSTTLELEYCDTFFSKFLGLMFRKEIQPGEGIILVESNESRVNTSIHMLFMHFDITVVWLDKQLVVVDRVLARKWRPFYFPKKAAQYVVEIHQSKFDEISIGDGFILTS